MLEKFLVMATISSNLQINWSDILFKTLIAMIKKENQSQGFAIQICHMLIDAGVQPVDMTEIGNRAKVTGSIPIDCKE